MNLISFSGQDQTEGVFFLSGKKDYAKLSDKVALSEIHKSKYTKKVHLLGALESESRATASQGAALLFLAADTPCPA